MPRARRNDPDGKAAPPTGPGLLRSLRAQLYRPRVLVGLALFVMACFAWPHIRRMLPALDALPEYRVRAEGIHITQPPRWVPSDLVRQVLKLADLPEELPLLDDNVVRDVAEAFAMHPWVEEVVSVTKRFPAAIEVRLTYRQPVAMVQVKQGLYPVDATGILLPPHDFSSSAAREYPQIVDVVSTPQGPAGTGWGDAVVTEAARLAAELAPHWKKLYLAAIHCPRVVAAHGPLDAGVFTLTTTGGSVIVWGHGPGSDHPGELATGKKIERLEKYAAKFGGLDQPQGRFRIDIRHWRDISRTPLSARGNPGEERR